MTDQKGQSVGKSSNLWLALWSQVWIKNFRFFNILVDQIKNI